MPTDFKLIFYVILSQRASIVSVLSDLELYSRPTCDIFTYYSWR